MTFGEILPLLTTLADPSVSQDQSGLSNVGPMTQKNIHRHFGSETQKLCSFRLVT